MRGADFDGRENPMSALLYKESGLQATVDLGMTVLQGRVLGGTTLINNCICFRLDDRDIVRGDTLAQWERLGAAIDPAAAGRVLRRGRGGDRRRPHRPGDRPRQRPAPARRLARAVRARARRPRAPAELVPQELQRLRRRRAVQLGLPARPQALRAGDLRDRRRRRRRARDARLPRRADRDRRRPRDRRARAPRRSATLRVRAGAVVVACGAIGSSVLLLKSGVRRNVGTRLSFNAATVMLARLPEPVHAYDGDQMTAYVDAGDYLLESSFQPPVSHAISVPGLVRRALRPDARLHALRELRRRRSAPTTTAASSTRGSCASCSARSSTA